MNNMELMELLKEKDDDKSKIQNKTNIWGSDKVNTYRQKHNDDLNSVTYKESNWYSDMIRYSENKWNERTCKGRYNKMIEVIEREKDFWDWCECIREHGE